jgi:enoyl-CoA hydratase/carnithine racemase
MAAAEPLVLRETAQDGAVAILRFNRPEKLNALSTPLLTLFERELAAVEADPAVRVLILTGAGEKAFVAGADIAEYQGRQDRKFIAYQLDSRRLFDRLEALPKPTIAAINGYALGGGFELALCCDVLVVSTRARLGLPEGLLGLSPGGGGTQRLLRSIGRHATADVLLSGARISGERAHQTGLAAALAEPEGLMEAALDKARAMLRLAPGSQAEMKRLIRVGPDSALPTALSLEQEVLFRLYGTADGQEGIDAFLAKREPRFRGE